MAWEEVVSKRTFQRYQRGGSWIPPQQYQACKRKEQARNRARNVGWGWQPHGKQPAGNGWPVHRRQPNTSGGESTGQAKPAPKAAMMSPEAVQAIVAQVLATIGQQGMPDQQAIRISEVITAAIPAAAASPQEQQDAERKWAQRVTHAHGKLRHWQAQHEARREAQRKISRQVESAWAHIEYWRATLDAANRKDPNWDSRDTFVDIEFDRDSLDCEEEEKDADLMDDDSRSLPQSGDTTDGKFAHANCFAPLVEAKPTMLGTPNPEPNALAQTPFGRQPLSSPSSFPPTAGSPFLLGNDGNTVTNDPLGTAANAHKQLLRAAGAKCNMPEELLEACIGDCPPVDHFLSSFHWAQLAVNAAITTKQIPDLSQVPLAQTMANLLWDLLRNPKTPEDPAPVEELPQNQEKAAGAPPAQG